MGLLGWLAVDLGINWVGWAFATAWKTEKFYDLLGSVSFATLTAGSLALSAGALTPRKLLVSALVGIWTLRLGTFLVQRIHKTGKDSRFDEVKSKPATFFVYWTMQALWVFISISPVLIVNIAPATAPLMWMDLAGTLVWAGGLTLEAVADKQKDTWCSKPENKGKFIDQGLWSISRHPNYLGEQIIWWGIFATCVGSFTSPLHYASVASPIVVMLLLNFVSGVPILEKQADARWGHLPEYQGYKARVPCLLPTLASSKGGATGAGGLGYQQVPPADVQHGERK